MFKLSLLENKIPIILKISRLILSLSLIMSFVSLVFIIFSTTRYYYPPFGNPSHLDIILALIIYATFYIIIFVAFPVTLILIICYSLFKLKIKKNIKTKIHFRLVIANILILLSTILLVVLQNN